MRHDSEPGAAWNEHGALGVIGIVLSLDRLALRG